MPNPPAFDTFAARLLWWCEKRGKTHQGKLAKELGIKQGSLSELSTGKSKTPKARVLLKLSDALSLRPQYLLTGEGPPEGQNFSELNGVEAQLVMLFRSLPSDALRAAMMIDMNEFVVRHKPKSPTAPTDLLGELGAGSPATRKRA